MSALRFVLVHGAWHEGSAWDATSAQLRALGHEVHAPTVAGHGHGVNKKLSHDDYVRSIADYIEQHELRDVVLVGHSLGGSVIARTAPKVLDRLRRLVFWNAFVPRDGEELVSPMPQAPMFAALAAASGGNTVTIPFEYFRDAFINDADLDTARRAYAQLSPEPYAPVIEPLDCKDFEELIATHRLPCSYLNCTEDSLLPWVSLMASRLGFYRLVQMPGSHEALFTNPALLAQKFVEAGRD